MRLFVLLALACFATAGCRKKAADPEPVSQGGSGFGAEQAVRGAVNRVVTAAELKDLHLFMTNAKAVLGRVPTMQETWTEINKPDGNRQLVKMIQDKLLVLVPNPQDEGLWAYATEAPERGGWVLTHSGPQRVTAQEFAQLQRGG